MPTHDHLITQEFTRQADAMSTAAHFNDETILDRICDAATMTAQSRALDVACGPGIVVEALAKRGGEIMGCDVTPAMLEKAMARARNGSLPLNPGRVWPRAAAW